MADCEYQRGVICSISREDFISFCGADLAFLEGVISFGYDESVFLQETGKRFALALRTDLQYFMSKEDLILNVCACKEVDLNIGSPDENLKVFVLEDVLNNHEIIVGETVWVRKANPVPLERIVVGISSEERFLWAKKLLAPFLCDSILVGPVTLRESDVFYLPEDQHEISIDSKGKQWFHFSVLQCEPVLQGSVTSETSLVVSKLDELDISSAPANSGAKTGKYQADSSDIFLVSDFARSLPWSLSQERSCNSSEGDPVERSNQLKVKVFDWDIKNDADLTCDANSRLYVSLATLIDLRLFNGTWVKICADHADALSDNKEEKHCSDVHEAPHHDPCDKSCNISKCHIVQVVAAASKTENKDYLNSGIGDSFIPFINCSEVQHGVGYITSVLHFNLFHKSTSYNATSPSISIHKIPDKAQIDADSSAASKDSKPPFATEAHISLVHSPHYKVGDSFDHALASHFKVPRVLTIGDVFYVHHNWQENGDAKTQPSSSDDQGKRDLLVYFQVIRLVCETDEVKSCLVDMEHSSLYQVSTQLSLFSTYLQVQSTQQYGSPGVRLYSSLSQVWSPSSLPESSGEKPGLPS